MYDRINLLCRGWTNLVDDINRAEVRRIGLCSVSSRINHSCEPNCTVTTLGNLVVVQSIIDIPSGTELTAARSTPVATLPHRREQLSHRNITCTCRRCHVESTDDKLVAIARKFDNLRSAMSSRLHGTLWRDIVALKAEIKAHPEARAVLWSSICLFQACVFLLDDAGSRKRYAETRAQGISKASLVDRCEFFEYALFFRSYGLAGISENDRLATNRLAAGAGGASGAADFNNANRAQA